MPRRSRSSTAASRALPAAQAHGAFVVVDEDGARRAAARLPSRPRGPLHGVPLAVKDLIDVAGLPTALGRSRGRVAARDAAIVARLREAGAIVLGKTRTDELGLGALTPGASDPQRRGPQPRRLERRLGDRGGDRRRPARARHGHRGERADPGRGVRRDRPLRRSRLDAHRRGLAARAQLRPARADRRRAERRRRRVDRPRRRDRRGAGARRSRSPTRRSAASSRSVSQPRATRPRS